MIQLNNPNNFGCKLRDLIYEKLEGKLINLDTIEIPKEYWNDVLLMSKYRQYDRVKDDVEEILEGVVIKGILKEILKNCKL